MGIQSEGKDEVVSSVGEYTEYLLDGVCPKL